MKRIVCNSVDFVFVNEIESINGQGIPVLKSGEWKKISNVEKPVYQSAVKQNDAGPTNEETVTVEARHNNLMQTLIDLCGFHVVLRMYTDDDETFFVGTIDYPAILEFTSDKIFDNFSFKAVSPA